MMARVTLQNESLTVLIRRYACIASGPMAEKGSVKMFLMYSYGLTNVWHASMLKACFFCLCIYGRFALENYGQIILEMGENSKLL